jgi:hypothetical protein
MTQFRGTLRPLLLTLAPVAIAGLFLGVMMVPGPTMELLAGPAGILAGLVASRLYRRQRS